jgi:hypothetical protein
VVFNFGGVESVPAIFSGMLLAIVFGHRDKRSGLDILFFCPER